MKMGQGKKIQNRMDMPIGVKPAARVQRAGTRIVPPRDLPEDIADEEDNSNNRRHHHAKDRSTGVDEEEENLSAIVLGSVMERPRRSKGLSKNKISSKFASTIHSNGFPSLRVAPVGTLVRPRPGGNKTQTERKEEIVEEEHEIPSANASDVETMLKDSERDATAMLQGMTTAEVQENVQDLRTSLDPSMIAFLQQRGRSKSARKPTKSVTFAQSSYASETTTPGETNNEILQTEFSMALASVRTYEDLDAMFDLHAKEHGVISSQSLDTNGKSEFQIACELLRSTSPHQTLWAARCVARELESYLPSQQKALAKDFPKLLPVSLRCMLDSNISSGGSSIQATHVLQSTYALLQLCACPDHVVDVTGQRQDDAVIYQLYTLDDAVPKPRIRSCYETITAQSIATSDIGSAYATQSSALSAQADAEAFWKDPMWTLLSRMQMLPRLATITRMARGLPEEAWVSICGILAMLGQRSPGAASAIIEHESLLPSLEDRLWFARGEYQPSKTLPIVILYCTLARQSRYSAQRVADRTNNKIVEILSLGEAKHVQWELLHSWALVLWRTLLRYGLSASITQSVLILATPAMTLGIKSDSSFVTAGFYSCFANFLKYASTCSLYSESKSADEQMSSSPNELVAQTALWLTAESSWRQVLNHLHIASEDDGSPSSCAFFSSIFTFIRASLHHVIETIGQEAAGHTKTELAGRMEDISYTLRDCMQNTFIGALVPTVARRLEIPNEEMAMEQEASAYALVTSLSSLLIFLTKQADLRGLLRKSAIPAMCCWTKNFDWVSIPTSALTLSRLRWLNLNLASMLLANESTSESSWSEQSLAFLLIGRLQCGEEALLAAVLNNGLLNAGGRDLTKLATALATLIGGSSSSRVQLQHSRLLLDSFSSHENLNLGSASLDLKSLLPECGHTAVEDLLPMGEHWLWQMAAGSFRSGKTDTMAAEKENYVVMSDALEMIIEAETSETSSLMMYAKGLGLGPKVYWLLGVFLNGATSSFHGACEILSKYLRSWKAEECIVFTKVCREQHTQQCTKSSDDTGNVDPIAKKMLESNIPDVTVRALEALANDVCDKFLLDDHESSFGVMCTRVFLADGFPSKIRCLVLQRFRETIHLLSQESLNDNQKELLLCCVAPGMDIDSRRDPPELIDQLVDLYSNGTVIRPDDHFVKTLTIYVLARNIILNAMNGNQPALAVMYRRLNIVDRLVARQVFVVTDCYLNKNKEGSQSLIDTALNVSTRSIDFCETEHPDQTYSPAALALVLERRYENNA